MNLIIIGMRGAGKSNVSRRLSVLAKRTVMCTDVLIEYENGGRSISQILDDGGGDWRAFRDMEYAVVKKVAAMTNVIVDCGGGVIVDLDENGEEIFSERKVAELKKTGTIIWLKGDLKRLARKAAKKTEQRPTLDAQKSTEEIMRRRLPFYQRAADVVIDIEGKDRQVLAEKIFGQFETRL
ncbi:MAG: shikimate kinase [Alphaproteobacteria bacterium]|nr:shikimate kinase [Alphaproteobacteria bacterium]